MIILNFMLMLIIKIVILKFTLNKMFDELVIVKAVITVINVFIIYFFHLISL